MERNPYQALASFGLQLGFKGEWLEMVCRQANDRLSHCDHGDFPGWKDALDRLPEVRPMAELNRDAPRFGEDTRQGEGLRKLLMSLHPWRKGPLNIAGIHIDTEWRSDWKWGRISQHVDLAGMKILDIGCGNGYYGWRMLAEGADLVIGIDPTWVYVMQWLACRHFGGNLPNFVLPLAIEDLPEKKVGFDGVFSMGVLYHRRDPVHHLRRIHGLLGDSGLLVLETLVLPDALSDEELVPRGRYARMRNVWSVPGCGRLSAWLEKSGFTCVEFVHLGMTTTDEQRSTDWMTFESLEKSLDTGDASLTIEGHPAPRRAVVIARKA